MGQKQSEHCSNLEIRTEKWTVPKDAPETSLTIKELFLCFQKLVSGELHTFYFGRFPSPGIKPGSLE